MLGDVYHHDGYYNYTTIPCLVYIIYNHDRYYNNTPQAVLYNHNERSYNYAAQAAQSLVYTVPQHT